MPNEVSLLHNILHSTPTSLQDEKCLVGSPKREVSGDRGIKMTFYTEDGLSRFQVQVKSSKVGGAGHMAQKGPTTSQKRSLK